MFLVPIVCRKLVEKSDLTLYQCWILLERNGTFCMSIVDEAEAIAFAKENDLVYSGILRNRDSLYMGVRPTASLADFYTWADISPGQQPMRECWRSFVWSVPNIGCNDGLKEIEVGPGSVYELLEGYFGLRTH